MGKSESFLLWGVLLFALFAIFRTIQTSNYDNTFFGFFLLLCILIYFFIKNSKVIHTKISPYSTIIGKINDIIFIFLYILSIFSLYYHSNPFERPIIFFIFFICMMGSVLLQILFGDNKYFSILLKIIFLELFYTLTQALLFKSLMSMDSYDHLSITNTIIKNGHIDPFTQAYGYFFHFLHAEIQLISGLDYNYSNLIFFLSATVICVVLTIFLIGRELMTPQVGLLASFILISSTYFIIFSINLIPNSYSAIYLLFALYFLLRIDESQNNNIYMSLLVFFIIFTSLTHLLVNLILVIILTIYLICINIRTNSTKNYMLIAFSIIIFFGLTIYVFKFFSTTTAFLTSGMDVYKLHISSPLRTIDPNVRPFFEVFQEKLSMYLFWIVSIPGCLYLMQKSNKNIKTFSFSFAILSFFGFFLLILISGRDFVNIRVHYLNSFAVCIFSAIFIILIFQSVRKTYEKVGVIIIILLLCIVSMIAPQANITNPSFNSWAGPQIYPFESELSMISLLRTMDSKPLASDSGFEYTENKSGRADIISIDASLYYLNFFPEKDHTIILRDSIFKMTPGKEIFFPEKEIITYSLAANKFSKIFDVGRASSFIHY